MNVTCRWRSCTSILVALLAVAGSASAQSTTTPPTANDGVVGWASLGFGPHLGGRLTSSTTAGLDGRTLRLDENSWGDRYDPAVSWQFGLAFPVSPDGYVFGSTTWERAEADPAGAGLVENQPITLRFDDYRAWGLEGGYRYLLPVDVAPVRPFVTASLGLKLVNAISVGLSAPVGVAVNDLAAYDDSWLWQWRFGGGVLGDISDRVGWQVTLDLTYTSALGEAAGNTGVPRVSAPGGRWMLPVMAGVFYRF